MQYVRPPQKMLQYGVGCRYTFDYNGKRRSDVEVVGKDYVNNLITCLTKSGEYRSFHIDKIHEVTT